MKRCLITNNKKQGVRCSSVNCILFALFLLALLYPPFVSEELLQVKLFASSANYVALVFGIALLLTNWEKVRFDSFFWILSGLSGVMILSTVFSGGQIESAISTSVKYVLLCLVICVMYQTNYVNMVQIFAGIFSIYILLNLLVWIHVSGSYPNGFREGDFVNMWFLGNKNTIRNYVLPGLAFMLIWELCIKKRSPILSVLLFGVSITSLVLVDSVTPTIVIICVGLLFVLSYKDKINLTYKGIAIVFFVIMTVVFLAPVVFSDGVLLQLINRDLTYSGRTYIWQQAIDAIGDHLLFGVGLQDLVNQGLLDRGDFRHVNHAHNAIIDMQFKYGIIALSLSFMLLAIAVKGLSFMNQEKQKIMLCVIFAFLLCGLFGELSNEMFLMILIFATQGKMDVSNKDERGISDDT